MSSRDYDQDVIKHFVRRDGWLEACLHRSKRVTNAVMGERRTEPFRYFTFCASQAIDVFMLEKANILSRDKATKRLNHAFFCESNDLEFEKIANLLGSREAGFLGDFKDFVLFEDDADTVNVNVFDNDAPVPESATVRGKLGQKKLNLGFRSLFPLDVINLDICGIFFPPHTNVISPMLESVNKMFKWQKESKSSADAHPCEGFTLMITTHVEAEACNPNVISNLVQLAQKNMDDYPEFNKRILNRYNNQSPESLSRNNFPVFFSIIFPKVIAHVAREHGWFGEHRRVYIYTRPEHPRYHMMCSVVHYERMIQTPHVLPGNHKSVWPADYEGKYLNEICNIVSYKPLDVNKRLVDDPQLELETSNDLRSIVKYRQDFRSSLSLG